ncbi:MAG: tRNA-dihydrouridine synthase family protein [Chitinivibrionales bacterium]|nr:tRNA-dihydrouridine synthase family protein [Chitinivibrionales bacterium]MBD3394093.1 tRNA-dihydrouridine synthase family protein [Chitinivibrionales bacterium]
MDNYRKDLRLLLAPLRGVTPATFRNVFAAHFKGFSAALAPFITTARTRRSRRHHFRDILPENNRSWPVVPQLIGNDPSAFVECARVVRDLGYSQVNWNLGCPAPTVTRKHRGSALLSQPLRIRSFLETVVPQLPCRLSIKTRLGFEGPDQLAALMPLLNEFPLEEIIIHPRTGAQRYGGAIDYDRFGACLAASRCPVVYNGDIAAPGDCLALCRRFPRAAGWMIGRGALANPFLPSLIRGEPLPADPLAAVKAFHDDLYGRYRDELSGPAHVLGRMKELWSYLGLSLANGDALLKKIRKANRFAEYETAVEGHFASIGVGRILE